MAIIDARTIDGGGSIIETDDQGRIVRETKRQDLPPEWLETEVWGSDYQHRTDINHGTVQHKSLGDEDWTDGPLPE